MTFSSQHLLFLSLLLTGTIMAVSSPSWFMAWVGLELNLMSFIPLITSKTNQYPSEAALKYFLVQALGSAFIILSAPLMMNTDVFVSMLLMALLLKLGAAPFHSWFPSIMEGLNWTQCIFLMTIQKIAPIFLISHLISQTFVSKFIIFSSILSALVGSLGGLNQTSLRKILAFSSINHLSWMLIAMLLSDYSWLIYFFFYSVISSSIVIFFNLQQYFFFSQLFTNPFTSLTKSFTSSFALLSLGGLPPFSGFIPKWIIIEAMAYNHMFFPLLVLILSALITLYYYLRIAALPLLLMTTKTKLLSPSPPQLFSSYLAPLFLFFNIFGLLIPSFFLFL
uniref:NADH-ubiquinone oxidoreductase chain 2 n=1 Tax=Scyllarides latus TaxID=204053 RepID=L0E916_SCYLT|nr:NADH dehydrogenase subunit 2 [Scyllarides latus]AGA56128.1 NADH dehydrogenase subunit 2 [Scyllarides latus]